MLIKQRLAIPGERRDDRILHWVLMGGGGLLALVVIQEIAARDFGLSTGEALSELCLVAGILVGATGFAITLLFGIGMMCGCGLKRAAVSAICCLLPLACFMGSAHCTMSQALMPQKLEFKRRVKAMHEAREQGCLQAYCQHVDLSRVLSDRDRFLGDYGYVRLGGWRSSRGSSDCAAFYLFTGGLFVGQDDPDLSRNTLSGAF